MFKGHIVELVFVVFSWDGHDSFYPQNGAT